MREFHISRQARNQYQFNEDLFAYDGNVILANFHTVRQFVQKINQKRDLVNFPEQAVKAGQINAMGLIDEILHFIFGLYLHKSQPEAVKEALIMLEGQLGKSELDKCLHFFCDRFPSSAVYRNELSIEEYLNDSTEGRSNKEIVLEELILLWLANKNPAFQPYIEFFEDEWLAKNTAYVPMIQLLQKFFEMQPHFGPESTSVIEMLRSPAIAVPYSLEGQLDYIRTRWGFLLGKYLYQLLSSLDMIKEENKEVFQGPGPLIIPVYDHLLEGEVEQFSPDREWMPQLVLMAKNAYVWLDQLTKKYKKPILKLNEIPEEELIQLAEWGFTGLWLIGLWERSQASAQIKQWCGNPEAISSAYSLKSYDIAWDLGGEEAYQNLKQRSWAHGIRLASDMVPNHMAIDSSWVIDHPDWFVHSWESPFPSYSFNGSSLSPVDHVGIFVEDHYFTRNDAAVVFKRVERNTGSEMYIYHGNDGTNMPWNDTAQLNYLNPRVREEVIQTILNVARKFPIIRFDAAMTLTKRHFQRLWYPEPGSGGDIPSRAGKGLSKEQFNQAMPAEFWREVVDRVAAEVPDTLLLAEAFWLMEGYFVRTLGMHRVYNSAFMNILRNEENAKYRTLMKNTLEFDPEILKRYVNFMNNPDERTAIDQFGSGDKYFGILTLMVTLPGLPMFGHGQIEGFSEKYGMEYRRAYWDESVNQELVDRHEKQIFPLMHRRAQFSGVENFLLYDFFTPEGIVNEDVYAFSNGIGRNLSLVVYHNRFGHTRGWIKTSAAYLGKSINGDGRTLQHKTLSEALNLHVDDEHFVIYRDHVSELEFIQSSRQMSASGLFFDLEAYQCHVLMDMREVEDDAWQNYRHIHHYLEGRGVPSIQEAIKELIMQPVQNPFKMIANQVYFEYLISSQRMTIEDQIPEILVNEAAGKLENLYRGIEYYRGEIPDKPEALEEFEKRLQTVLSVRVLSTTLAYPGKNRLEEALQSLQKGFEKNPEKFMPILLGWLFTHQLDKFNGGGDTQSTGLDWMEEWQLDRILQNTYFDIVNNEKMATEQLNTVRMLILQKGWYSDLQKKSIKQILEAWLSKDEVQTYLGFNRYKGILWFNKEAFEEFVWWMEVLNLIEAASEKNSTATRLVERILEGHEIAATIRQAEERSDYQVALLFDALNG